MRRVGVQIAAAEPVARGVPWRSPSIEVIGPDALHTLKFVVTVTMDMAASIPTLNGIRY